MNKEREALKLALAALKDHVGNYKLGAAGCTQQAAAITAIKEALAQPEQEPEAWHDKIIGIEVSMDVSTGEGDAYHRVFGRVYEVMLEKYHATNDIILAIEESRNFTSPPKRELKSTTDMMMELADRLGELPDDVDPRAWEHLLVYAPKQKPVMEYDKEELRGTFWDTTPPKRKEWVGLTDDEIFKTHKQVDSMQYLTFGKAIEARLKEKNT